jgi:deoxyinosine 3'endonuclease (endonuclease V)
MMQQKRFVLKSVVKIITAKLVVGADVSYDKKNDRFYVGVIVFKLQTMEH